MMTAEEHLPVPSYMPADIDPRTEAMLVHPSSALDESEVCELISSRSETEPTESDLDRLAKREDLLAKLAQTSLRRRIGRSTIRHLENDLNIRARHRSDRTQE